eukprot:SAG11_NODE_38920_length_246_cov_2.918367_1_plen_81_part_11
MCAQCEIKAGRSVNMQSTWAAVEALVQSSGVVESDGPHTDIAPVDMSILTPLSQGTSLPSDRLSDLRAGAWRRREHHQGRH